MQTVPPFLLSLSKPKGAKTHKPRKQKSSKTCHINAHLYLGLFENGGFIPNIRPSNRRENP